MTTGVTARIIGLLKNLFGLSAIGAGGGISVAGHVLATGSAPGAAAGANAGTSPPAPVVTAGSNDIRGNFTFGTGTTPAAGAMVAVTFATAFAAAPIVTLTWANANGAGLGQAYVTGVSGSGFTINCTTAPAGSQANTFYSINYEVIG